MTVVARAAVGTVGLVAGAVLFAESTGGDADDTIIYRRGSNTYKNLTPREVDIDGLSFSLTPFPGNNSVTSLNVVNSTGVLQAVIDRPGHVSVSSKSPGMMQDWISSRQNAEVNPHPLTVVLHSIVKPIKIAN